MSAADLFKSIAEVLDELPQSTSALQELVAELRDQAQAMERKLADERLEMERIRSELLRALEATRLQQESVGADVKAEARAEARRVSAEISELEQEVAEAVRVSEQTSAQLAERVAEAHQAAMRACTRADEVAHQAAPSSAIAEAAEAMTQMKREMQEARDDLSRRLGDVNTRISKVFVSPPPSSIQVKKDGVKVGERRAINFTGSGVTITDDRDGVEVAISGSGGGGDVVTNVAQDRILGRVTAGSGDSEELTAAQVRTLLNVEDGATADQTAAEILTALLTVDGTGSGLDADLLDGQSSAFYAADSAVVHDTGDETIAGVKTFSSAVATGATPASAGAVRLSNTDWIRARNAAGSADVSMFRVRTSDAIEVGAKLHYDETGSFTDRNAVTTINRNLTSVTTGIWPTVHILTKSIGDNTTFIGAAGMSITALDQATVASGTKGVLYGLQVSIQPLLARNNVPYDDATGIVVQNDGTAKGTDAIYVGNGSIVGREWIAGVLVESNCDFGLRTVGTVGYGLDIGGTVDNHAIRIQNTHSLAARNNAGSADVSLISLDTSDRVSLRGGAILINSANSVSIGSSPSFGSGERVMFLQNAAVVPSTNPTGGGVLYSEGGALKWRGSSGTVTILAAA